MNTQHSANVMQVIVRRIMERARSIKESLRRLRVSEPNLEMDWDDAACATDTTLANDQGVLRDLEAEIYALTDQFKTEQDLAGARSV